MYVLGLTPQKIGGIEKFMLIYSRYGKIGEDAGIH